MDWFIVYADGEVYTSDDGPPELAPADGVQVIGQRNSGVPGAHLIHGSDFYYWAPEWGGWNGTRDELNAGIVNYLHRDGWAKVLFGRNATDEDYQNCLRLAIALKEKQWPTN